MQPGIFRMETLSNNKTIDIEELAKAYSHEYSPEQADWKMMEHLQQQAMVYTNIIERVKSGESAPVIRQRFEELELVLPGSLPNPHGLLDFALEKLSKYRQAMVDFVKIRGTDFINDLSSQVGLTVSLGLELGFPPAISLNFEAGGDLFEEE